MNPRNWTGCTGRPKSEAEKAIEAALEAKIRQRCDIMAEEQALREALRIVQQMQS